MAPGSRLCPLFFKLLADRAVARLLPGCIFLALADEFEYLLFRHYQIFDVDPHAEDDYVGGQCGLIDEVGPAHLVFE